MKPIPKASAGQQEAAGLGLDQQQGQDPDADVEAADEAGRRRFRQLRGQPVLAVGHRPLECLGEFRAAVLRLGVRPVSWS